MLGFQGDAIVPVQHLAGGGGGGAVEGIGGVNLQARLGGQQGQPAA